MDTESADDLRDIIRYIADSDISGTCKITLTLMISQILQSEVRSGE